MEGTVKFFNLEKGYGFITPDGGGNDIFVHYNDVEAAGFKTLEEGQRIAFDIQKDPRGNVKAINLRVVTEQKTLTKPTTENVPLHDPVGAGALAAAFMFAMIVRRYE